MTANQIRYQEMLTNRASQQETARSNKAKERETNRHNVRTENENERHNFATEYETERNNRAVAKENNRHNLAAETETHRHNTQAEAMGWVEAATGGVVDVSKAAKNVSDIIDTWTVDMQDAVTTLITGG